MLWLWCWILSIVNALRLAPLTAQRIWQDFTAAASTRILHSARINDELLGLLQMNRYPMRSIYEAGCRRQLDVSRLHDILRTVGENKQLLHWLLGPECLSRTIYCTELTDEIAERVLPYSPLLLLNSRQMGDLNGTLIRKSLERASRMGDYPMKDGDWINHLIPDMLVHQDWHWREGVWEAFTPSCFERKALVAYTMVHERVQHRIISLITNFRMTKSFLIRAAVRGDNIHMLCRVVLRLANILARFPKEYSDYTGIKSKIYAKLSKVFLSLRDAMILVGMRSNSTPHFNVNNLMILISNILSRATQRDILNPKEHPPMNQIPLHGQPPPFLSIFNLAVNDLEWNDDTPPARLAHWKLAVVEYYWKEEDEMLVNLVGELLKGPCWPVDMDSWLSKMAKSSQHDHTALWVEAAKHNPQIIEVVMHQACDASTYISRSSDVPELLAYVARAVVPLHTRLSWARANRGLTRLLPVYPHDPNDWQRLSWNFFAMNQLNVPAESSITLRQVINIYFDQLSWYSNGSKTSWCLELLDTNEMRRFGAILAACLLLDIRPPRSIDATQLSAFLNRLYNLWDEKEMHRSTLPFVFTKLQPISGVEMVTNQLLSPMEDYLRIANIRLQTAHHKLFQMFPLIALFSNEELVDLLTPNSDN